MAVARGAQHHGALVENRQNLLMMQIRRCEQGAAAAVLRTRNSGSSRRCQQGQQHPLLLRWHWHRHHATAHPPPPSAPSDCQALPLLELAEGLNAAAWVRAIPAHVTASLHAYAKAVRHKMRPQRSSSKGSTMLALMLSWRSWAFSYQLADCSRRHLVCYKNSSNRQLHRMCHPHLAWAAAWT